MAKKTNPGRPQQMVTERNARTGHSRPITMSAERFAHYLADVLNLPVDRACKLAAVIQRLN